MNSSLGNILAKVKLSGDYLWMKINVSAFLCVLCLCLGACQSTPVPPVKTLVQVDRAVSGNTIELSDKQRVRLIGLDAPSWEQKPWGNAAKDRLNEIIKQQKNRFLLELEPSPLITNSTDSRQYGYLWQNDQLINEQLIREGHALAVTKYASLRYEQQLVRAQAYARLTNVGIWNHESPMRTSPTDFKSKN
jgi:micrococcal nuclease